ncbi:MAG: tRNA (cytidine(34)-2'-O)-methyltransferase [Rhodothalassiaceae bacterium]
MVALALFQPDQAANVGTILRLGACLDVPVHVIEPCGFAFSERALRRAGMDYLDHVRLTRHDDWRQFHQPSHGRLILLTSRAATPYTKFRFQPDDRLLLGQESAGAPDYVHAAADARLLIPMAPGRRSLNIAVAAAMVLGEALRQTAGFPTPQAS